MIRILCFQIIFARAIHSSMILPPSLKEYMYVCDVSWLDCERVAEGIVSCACSVSIRLQSTCRMHWRRRGFKQFKI